jgi:hypothetical protein
VTTTTVEQGLDIASILTLDFTYDLPCEFNRGQSGNRGCEDVAEWKIITSCCGASLFFCDNHFWLLVEQCNNPNINMTHPKQSGGCGAKEGVKIAHAERLDKR